ncbi:MAG: ATP-binding protein [Bacteroidia bacterium]|nr:ATP-binding protein [Bacteroidia bacterium]
MSRMENPISLDDYRLKVQELQQTIQEKEAILRQIETQSTSVFDFLPVMVMILDPHSFRIVHANNAVVQILGYSNEFLLSQNFDVLCADLFKEDVKRQLKALYLHRKTSISEIVVQKQNGSGLDVVLKAQFSEENIFVVIHNVSNYKKYERLNRILESRVEKRTAALNEQLDYITLQNRQLNDFKSALLNVMEDLKKEQKNYSEVKRLVQELRQSNEDLEQYASLASHDLKAPLRTITAHLQVLANKLGDRLVPEERIFLDFAIEGAQKMDHLLSGILEYSRVSREKKPFQRVDMNEVIADVLINLELQIAESDASIECADLPVLDGDYLQLLQLTQNLIGNGIKFRGIYPPHINIFCETTPSHFLFMVRDNGIGIEKENIDKIFKIFEQLDNGRNYPGNGLGLAICKGIVQRHGGKIWAESRPGNGTTFFFTIER